MGVVAEEQLKAALEDTQASLAAALARIEAFRLKERQLLAELSEFRKQVNAKPGGDGSQSGTPRVSNGPVQSPLTAARSQNLGTTSVKQELTGTASRQQHASAWEGARQYVTVCNGQHAACIVDGKRKTPVSLIITEDTVEFVEVKARITQGDFIGVSTFKPTASLLPPTPPASQPAKSGFLCCVRGAADLPHPASEAASRIEQASRSETQTETNALAAPPCKALDPYERGSQQGTSPSSSRASASGSTGVWQILWGRGGPPNRLAFEASQAVRESIHRHTQRWLGVSAEDCGVSSEGQGSGEAPSDDTAIVAPRNMPVSSHTFNVVGEASGILAPLHVSALAGVLPPLERLREWALCYSTQRHGISLQTLYRRSSGRTHNTPTLLLVKDFGGYMFGCYTAEGWRIAPRFYGTGETFVFQLEPHRVMYPWRSMSKAKNDFFMYGTQDCLAVGGLGHFAIWLDAELLHGSSGSCGTFGSPCLASGEEFKIQALEVWHAVM